MHLRSKKIRTKRWLQPLHRFRSDERGTQLAEASIILPIFLILFAATAEFGRYFYEYTTLAKAARVGARYLVTAKVDCNQATIAKNLVVFGTTDGTGSPILSGLTVNNVSVTPNDQACSGTPQGVPETITVSITGFTHQSVFDLGGLVNNANASLSIEVKPSVTMRYLLSTPLV